METNKVIEKCNTIFDLKNAKLSDEYYYFSLPFCIIDAIFSIGVRYTSTRNTVKRYCEHFVLIRLRNKTTDYAEKNKQHTISELIENIEKYGVDKFSDDVLANRQRTSSRNGILKTEAVFQWAQVFEKHNIQTLNDIDPNGLNIKIESELLQVSGQKSGISLKYFYMLSGNDDLCKPDRHILSFLSETLNRNVSVSEAQKILSDTVIRLKNEYPQITVRMLDHTIWNYMSSKK